MTKAFRDCIAAALITALGYGVVYASQSAGSISAFGAGLAGHYDNAAQVRQGTMILGKHPPQHVTVTVQPTGTPGWQLWRIHMDVSTDVARSAKASTSLDAIWAMHITRAADGKSLQIMPYSLKHSADERVVKAAAFDKSKWYAIQGCGLSVETMKPNMIAFAPPSRRCLAEKMALGGKRAFLPSWIERRGDTLEIQLTYFGAPWRVEAKRMPD